MNTLTSVRRVCASHGIVSFAALAGALAAPATVLAQDEPEESGSATILIVGHAHADEAEAQVRATPGGADVVGYEDYADKSLVSVRDALAFSPGVYTQPRFGQEVRISIRGSGISRGFHMRGLTLLQDGVPINLADDNGDFQELEPAFFHHLEVYRGANALRFGSGTLGGAVNGITPTGDQAPGLYLRADAGSFDMLRALVAAGFGDEDANAWTALSADTHDGDRQHARRSSVRFHGNVGGRLSHAVSTRFYVSYNSLDQELPGALALARALTAPETGNLAGDQQRNIDSFRAQNRTTIELGAATLNFGAFVNRKKLDHPIFQVIDQHSTDKGAFARLDYAAGAFEATLGGESRWGTIDSRRFVNRNGRRGALTFAADQSARTSNLYAEVRFKPAPNLSLIAGGIYADGFREQNQLVPAPVRASASFDAFSPKFGVLWEPDTEIQVYANYSASAEFPTFVELAQIAAFVPVNEQRAWTAEVGTRGRRGWFAWDVSLYRATLEDEMLQYTVGPDIPASTFNADSTLHQGVEAGFTLEPADWLRFRQIWQYSDFRFRDDVQFGDNRLPVVPRNVLRSELRIGGDRLHVAPNVERVPQGAWADYSNTVRAPGYALLGLTAGATLREGLDLFLDIRNVTGKKAVGDISAAVVATPASVIYYPVERRAVYGGARARF
jgi:iron complex outermembrane receptor protein